MKIFFVLALCFGFNALAADPDPKPDMHALAAEISALQKYLFSEAKFADPANAKEIESSLASINGHLGHLKFPDDPALKVNLSLLQQHMKDADRAFKNGSKPFARYMLQSSLQMCIACHTRKETSDFSWPEPGVKDADPLERAEYLFATRQFTKGKEVYESIVSGYPENGTNQWALRKALLALAIYYARVKEDPAEGGKYFQKMSATEKLPVFLREEMKAWAKEFTDWSKEKPAKKAESEAVLLARAKKLLKKDDFSLVSELGQSFHVRRLRASVLLQKVLESPGARSPLKAEALLYLGQIYSRISSSLFFQFGRMYLKECILEYPKTSTARSCYVALESVVSEGYTGSSGTNIPDDEQMELVRLKRMAY